MVWMRTPLRRVCKLGLPDRLADDRRDQLLEFVQHQPLGFAIFASRLGVDDSLCYLNFGPVFIRIEPQIEIVPPAFALVLELHVLQLEGDRGRDFLRAALPLRARFERSLKALPDIFFP